jgi:predicted metalloprotease
MFGMNFWTYVPAWLLDFDRVDFFRRWAFRLLSGAAVLLPAVSAVASHYDPASRVRFLMTSTATEWSRVFSARGRPYQEPRVMITRLPRHHPERAAGYYRGLAITIDLGELEDIAALFPRDSETLTALVVAHEVAHHVQFLNRRYGKVLASPDPIYELEADCAAGWWLGRANAESVAASGAVRFPTKDLDRQLPRLFQALYTLQYRRLDAPPPEVAIRHGTDGERIAAFKHGLNITDPAQCGLGVAP